MKLPMKLVLLFVLSLAPLACVPRPKQDYTLEQLGSLDSLEELMRVQAHTADPLFAKREQTSFTEQELGAVRQASRRIQVTATRLRDGFARDYPPSFAAHAGRLLTAATALQQAAEARQTAAAGVALKSMREACASCHRKFK